MTRESRPSRHAFVDESRRGDTYYLTAALVLTKDLGQCSKAIREGLPKGRRRAHFSREGDRIRKQIIDLSCSLPTNLIVVVAYGECGTDEERARQACLRALLPGLARRHVVTLVLDSRGERDQRDRQTLARTLAELRVDMHYSHRGSRDEPLLGLADAFGWCFGAGKRWSQQVAPHIVSVVKA
jgi:hypothetical protein